MKLHYLFSDKRVTRAATITFNGDVQRHCIQVDDDKGFIVRRTFNANSEIIGKETLYGDVVITLPEDVRGGPYRTKPKATDNHESAAPGAGAGVLDSHLADKAGARMDSHMNEVAQRLFATMLDICSGDYYQSNGVDIRAEPWSKLWNDGSEFAGMWNGRIASVLADSARARVGGEPFQARVSKWMDECFLPSLYSNMTERGDRLLEEVLELLQSSGYDQARVETLVRYVFGRPVGEPSQEVGGVMVTLAGYCWVAGLDMHAAGEAELARINDPAMMAKIRTKQESKNAMHFDTPLPGGAGQQPPVKCSCPSGDGSLRWPCPTHPPMQPSVPVQALKALREHIGNNAAGAGMACFNYSETQTQVIGAFHSCQALVDDLIAAHDSKAS